MRILNSNVLVDTSKISHEEWLNYRRKGIGGSDAAAVLGLNKYSSAFQVYCDKLNLTPEIEDNEAMRQGRDFEDYVAKRFEEATGKKTKKCNYMLMHREHSCLIADVDRLIVGEKAGLECKTTSILNKTKFDENDIMAAHYVQCVHYLAVTGAEKWYLAVLVLNRGFYWFCIERKDVEEDIRQLMESELKFWTSHVLAQIPPAPDGSERAGEALKAIYPKGEDDLEIQLFLYDEALEQIALFKSQIYELESQKDKLIQEVQAYMKEATLGVSDRYIATWRNQNDTRIDIKRLKAEQPDIYTQYSNTKSIRKFLLKEKKL